MLTVSNSFTAKIHVYSGKKKSVVSLPLHFTSLDQKQANEVPGAKFLTIGSTVNRTIET